jgi:thiazole tautomerase (transcriptional regulator TenI)
MLPRFPRPAIYLVTSGAARAAGDRSVDDLVALAARASAAGVNVVQLREPQLADTALLPLTRRVLGAVDRSRTLVVVNDRPDVAVAAGADGVHLRSSAMAASRVRAIAPPAFVVGRSVHSATEAREAAADGGADYLIFGTVFPSASKPAGHPTAGVEELRKACAASTRPVVAIGGLTAARAAEVAAAGAAGVAAIGMFRDADRDTDLAALVRQLRRAFDTRGSVV